MIYLCCADFKVENEFDVRCCGSCHDDDEDYLASLMEIETEEYLLRLCCTMQIAFKKQFGDIEPVFAELESFLKKKEKS